MKNLIFILSLLSGILFFILMILIGKNYEGREGDNSYVLFCVTCALMSFVGIFFDVIKIKHFSIKVSTLCFVLLPFFMIFCYFFEMSSGELAKKYFYQYVIWGIPATYVGINVASYDRIKEMAYWWFWTMLFLSAGIMIVTFLPLVRGGFFREGMAYQTISYISSLAFSLNLCFVLFKAHLILPKIAYRSFFSLVSYLLLFMQVAGVLISGGRGGFVVIFLSMIVLLYVKWKIKEIKASFLIYLLLTGGVIIFLMGSLEGNEELLYGFERVFSYLSSDGIDMGQTSGRDIVYGQALDLIAQKPLIGYGIFKYFDIAMYPHNLFLELLLARGLFLLLLFLGISIYWFKRFRLIIKGDFSNILLLPMAVYTFAFLMFSGTYLDVPLFWFLGAYVFCYPLKKHFCR